MKQFLRDQRGHGEAISFVFVAVLLMLVVLNITPPVMDLVRYWTLSRVHRETLLRMEIAGGLTPEIEGRARDSLAASGFAPTQLVVTGTPAVADYGSPLSLDITYTYTHRQYAASSFVIYPVDAPRTMVAAGASVSFNFAK